MNSLLRAVLREPLVHFLVAGGALFLAHARLERPPPERIVVSSAFVLALREEQRAQTGKLPSDDETRGLVERYARVTDRDVSSIGFHRVLGLFKVAVIAQQIYWRFAKGLTQDERFAMLGFAVQILANVAEQATRTDGL